MTKSVDMFPTPEEEPKGRQIKVFEHLSVGYLEGYLHADGLRKLRIREIGKAVYNDLILAREGSIVQEIGNQIGRLEQAKKQCQEMLPDYTDVFLGRIRHAKKIGEIKKSIYTYGMMIETYNRAIKICREETNKTIVIKDDESQ